MNFYNLTAYQLNFEKVNNDNDDGMMPDGGWAETELGQTNNK